MMELGMILRRFFWTAVEGTCPETKEAAVDNYPERVESAVVF